ncbi:MAG TPA: hypothetical protein VF851_06500 [Steroidobacteraceae bacterium]
MEMTWLETFKLLGLDLLAVLILALVVLEGVDHAVHHAWLATRERFGMGRTRSPVRRPTRIGAPRHV